MDYVISANLRRRHLSESQRAQAMANLCTLARGRPASQVVTIDAEPALFEVAPVDVKTNPSIEGLTTAQAAEKAGVTVATMERAIAVDRKGSPELIDAVKRGEIADCYQKWSSHQIANLYQARLLRVAMSVPCVFSRLELSDREGGRAVVLVMRRC